MLCYITEIKKRKSMIVQSVDNGVSGSRDAIHQSTSCSRACMRTARHLDTHGRREKKTVGVSSALGEVISGNELYARR